MALLLALSGQLQAKAADTNFIAAMVPDAKLVGQGTLSYMMWDVYAASLLAPDGQFSADRPFALQLEYKRHVDGKTIADASASEIRRQGFHDQARLDSWHRQMLQLFTDVSPGTSLTGVNRPGQPACFFRDGAPIGCIDDPDFGPVFFAIWLAPSTREPALRQALLGQP